MSDCGERLVWVFNGPHGRFPSGVFTSVESAEAWIAKHGLSGVLTGYPLDKGAWDWTTARGYFKAKREDQATAPFIANFASGRHHIHYEDGRRAS